MAKRFVLIALLALASHALLPYLHALASGCDSHAPTCSAEGQTPPSHSPDCAVCGVIAQAGARALDAPATPATVSEPLSLAAAVSECLAATPSVALDTSCARAPPASPRAA